MKTIHKHVLDIVDEIQELTIPQNSKILFVGNQNGNLTFWIEVDTASTPIMRSFVVHGTGHPIRNNEIYIGSAMIAPYVWHVYEVIGEK